MDEGYFSHLPFLAAAITQTSGPVLELGAGLGSTLMLHGLCGAFGRELVTIESDTEWIRKFLSFKRSWHKIRYVKDFRDLPEYSEEWGLAFVDHGIAEQRGHSVAKLKDTPIIVAHDTCHPHLYGYEPILSQFSNRWDWRVEGPRTSVVSNTIKVAEIFSRMTL